MEGGRGTEEVPFHPRRLKETSQGGTTDLSLTGRKEGSRAHQVGKATKANARGLEVCGREMAAAFGGDRHACGFIAAMPGQEVLRDVWDRS